LTVADDDLQLYNFTGSKNFNTYIFTVTYTTALAKTEWYNIFYNV